MSEERRISLAELLAREGGAPAAPTGGRRRRHRGGENSITVAELTGEIPVVRDDRPAPGETQAPEAPAPEPQVRPAAQAPAAEAAEPEVVEPEVVELEVVEPEVVAPDAAEAPAAQAPAGQADDDEPITSSFLAAAVADPGRADAAAEGPVEQDSTEEAHAVEAEPVAEAEPEAPAARAPRRSGLLRWGRGNRSESTEQASSEHAPAEEAVPAAAADTAAATEAAEPPAAAAQSEDGTDYAWSRWDQAETPIMATSDFNTAQVRERQSRFAEIEADDTVDVAPVSVPDPEAPSAPDTAALSAAQIDGAREARTPDFLAEPGATDDHDADEKAPSTGKGQGWLALIAEVVLGLAVGAGLFYGFFKLWNWGGGAWTYALTTVLAFIVIIGIVTFTHYLRKTTDYLTLGLALFVGLVITFGPLLMALGSN